MRLGEAFHYVYLKPKWSRGGTEIPQGMMGVLHIVFNLERSNTQRVCGAEGRADDVVTGLRSADHC